MNIRASLYHFLQLDLKYSGAFTIEEYHHRVTTMLNAFFTRNWGVSYRFSYTGTSATDNMYHLLGVAYIF